MFSLSTKAGRTLIAMTVALACMPAVASAGPVDVVPSQDLRSPDARDAANRQQSPTSSLAGTTSSRPDAHANAAASRIEARQDLRSPDTRDIAAGREYPPTPTVVTLREARAPEVTNSGFNWVAALTGASAAFGLILLTTAAALLIRRRTHREQPVAVA
jgi:hypothetical protein